MALHGAEAPRDNAIVARAKKKEKSGAEELWEEYQRIQLTPEQKAEARCRLEAQSNDAARNGVWEQFLALEGKVHLDLDIDELREDRD